MKNNKLIPIIVASMNAVLCTLMLIFLTPNQIPLIAGLRDEIIVIGPKWWLLLGIFIPLVYMILSISLKNQYAKFIFTELLIFTVFDNLLGYSYFCNVTRFEIGMLSEVSYSVSVFIPLALFCFIYGAMIKNLPYKSRLGLKSKRTTTTEFIWTQSHISGSYYYRLTGMILFLVAVIFNFLHIPLIELLIFIIALIIPRVIVEVNAKQMTNKYKDIKAKHEHLTNKKG